MISIIHFFGDEGTVNKMRLMTTKTRKGRNIKQDEMLKNEEWIKERKEQ